MPKRNRRPRADSPAFGGLNLFKEDMRPRKGEHIAKLFTMRGVCWRLAAAGLLSAADLLAQAAWVVRSRNIGWDPWWLGVLGVDSERFDALGLFASIVGLSAAVGLAFLFVGLFLSHIRWIFLTGLAMVIAGISRMLGTGLGRTILYAQIMSGQTANDGFIDGYTGISQLSASDTIYGTWPAAVMGVVFAVVALVLALRPRTEGAKSSKLTLTLGAATAVGLVAIVLIESGIAPTQLILVGIALLIGFVVLPNEADCARALAQRAIDAKWQWHAAGLIWLETLLAFTAVMVAITGI